MDVTFKGFSTVGANKPPYELYDTELIKQDLKNYFSTRRGERVMMPEYGTIIYDIMMDPLDETSIQEIKKDIELGISQDPRVIVSTLGGGIKVLQSEHTVKVEVDLQYEVFGDSEKLLLEFEQDIKDAY